MKKRVFILEKVLDAAAILPVLSKDNEVFTIDSTASVKESMEYIKKNDYNLIYINIDYLDMNIIPLFINLRNRGFKDNIIFSGDYKKPSVVKKMGVFKSVDVLIKPFDGLWLKNTIIEYLETGKSIGNESESILSPYFIFRLIDYENGNISLKILFNGNKGFVIFEGGFAVYAKYAETEGKEALRNIVNIRMKSNRMDIKITSPGLFTKKNIKVNIAEILKEFDSSSSIPNL